MTPYSQIVPIDAPISADRQSAKRHYGVHPYFTRRPHNVVRSYILNYSFEGDVVLDPFGGSGVTAIESFLENRVGIQNDINPLANFIAEGIVNLSYGALCDYRDSLHFLKEKCERQINVISTMQPQQLVQFQQSLKMPPDIELPGSSDVSRYYDLFSPVQITALALLKDSISEISNPWARRAMLLAWSATLAKLNKTFLSAEGRAESRGGSSIFSIYRYKVAAVPVELPIWQTFEERANNVIVAKSEIDKTIEVKRKTTGWNGKFAVYSKDIDELASEWSEQVDYIFTDPPYGGHISYLDLSTLWNCWLDQMPGDQARGNELIVGGEKKIKESVYLNRLGESVVKCLRMLRPERWLSIVFQHWNVAYFDAILSAAESGGAELRAAISQVGDPIWSMHKKKGNESVLAGEMILTFMKTGRPKKRPLVNGFNVPEAVKQVLAHVKGNEIYGELLFNKIVIKAWESGAIGSLNISKNEFALMMKENGWSYFEQHHSWRKGILPSPETLFAQNDVGQSD